MTTHKHEQIFNKVFFVPNFFSSSSGPLHEYVLFHSADGKEKNPSVPEHSFSKWWETMKQWL